ncbi:RNA-binding KH domain-containing protein [Perilla frutescens var. hirtella]|uniref:RNA-binding KH domain-containing protein n=1 Tax=Perilla frutescens var. hirtella TaxID=608512 RepID=A0AAD4IYN4_PERFH|nr:RNA-binding KH domain-containing protein [Perilla frutescens var. hirtella]
MVEVNIGEQDLDNVQEMDNVQKEQDLSNVQEMDNVEEEQDLDNGQEMDNVEEEQDLDNGQEMDNVQEEHDLANVPEMDNVQEEHDLANVPEMDNVQKGHDLANVPEMDNVHEEHDLYNVQEMDNVQEEHDLDNVQEMDNVLENLRQPEDAKALSVVEEKKWPGWPGENVFRMLVPAQKVGGIIGRKGEYIKKICEETKARIKILDGPPGSMERTVMVSAKEEPDLTIPPALDGLLKIHKHINDLGSDAANAPAGGTFCTRLLVAATQAGSLIGKQGATIKSIQDDSHCTIRVIGGENLPAIALPDDSVVEIQGEPAGLDKAVEIIGTHLRKFLVDRSVIGVFEMQMQMPSGRANQNVHASQSWGPPQSAFPMNPGGHGYGSDHSYMAPPPHQYDDYYPPADMPSFDNQPRSGPPNYGRDMSMGAHATNVQPQQAVISKVTKNIQIQLAYADAVIGVNGANISYIRRTSGATIAIQETRGVPGEMTVEINGSASQVQAAHQLIQNSIADAMSSAQNPSGGPPMQGYNPYPSHGPVYGSSTSNAAGQASHVPAGDYGSMYDASYGY